MKCYGIYAVCCTYVHNARWSPPKWFLYRDRVVHTCTHTHFYCLCAICLSLVKVKLPSTPNSPPPLQTTLCYSLVRGLEKIPCL